MEMEIDTYGVGGNNVKKIQEEEEEPRVQVQTITTLFINRYYKTVFPCDLIYEFFIKDGTREVIFFPESGIPLRYCSFKDANSFRTFVGKRPFYSVHLGSYFDDGGPRKGVMPTKKHLVFDLDLKDYGNDRKCCSDEKKACSMCWYFAQIAIVIMKHILCILFGFKKVHFFFSGSKGFHCWVLDRLFDQEQLESIFCWFDRGKAFSSDQNNNNGAFRFSHPQMADIYEMYISDVWETVFNAHEIKADGKPESIMYILWPRLDTAVTLDMKHPIRCPFSYNDNGKTFQRYMADVREDPYDDSESNRDMKMVIRSFENALRSGEDSR